jgi:hypothetical protein
MKLLRHILSHLILISFLIAVVSVFYYRTLLLPGDVVGKIDEVVNDIYPPALKFASKRDYFWSIRGERIVSFDDLRFFKSEESVAVKEIIKPDSVSKESAVVEAVPVNKADVVLQDESNAKGTTTIVAAVKEPLPESKTEKVPVEINTAKELPVVINDSDTSSERDLLISARTAFNQGSVKKSEKFYLELIHLDNDNPDTFGELGNVYYSQGKWDEAGQAYYEAAVRLITEGNYNQVVYLQRVINGLNTEHAEKLAQLMMRK